MFGATCMILAVILFRRCHSLEIVEASITPANPVVDDTVTLSCVVDAAWQYCYWDFNDGERR